MLIIWPENQSLKPLGCCHKSLSKDGFPNIISGISVNMSDSRDAWKAKQEEEREEEEEEEEDVDDNVRPFIERFKA